MSGYEVNNSVSTVTTEKSFGTTRQLQDLLNNFVTNLRADTVTMTETKFQDVTITESNNSKFQAEYSNLRSSCLTTTEQLDSKLQAATENITAKIQQEKEESF
jgi:hypothetical protein